jgi:hypothetical protein
LIFRAGLGTQFKGSPEGNWQLTLISRLGYLKQNQNWVSFSAFEQGIFKKKHYKKSQHFLL